MRIVHGSCNRRGWAHWCKPSLFTRGVLPGGKTLKRRRDRRTQRSPRCWFGPMGAVDSPCRACCSELKFEDARFPSFVLLVVIKAAALLLIRRIVFAYMLNRMGSPQVSPSSARDRALTKRVLVALGAVTCLLLLVAFLSPSAPASSGGSAISLTSSPIAPSTRCLCIIAFEGTLAIKDSPAGNASDAVRCALGDRARRRQGQADTGAVQLCRLCTSEGFFGGIGVTTSQPTPERIM